MRKDPLYVSLRMSLHIRKERLYALKPWCVKIPERDYKTQSLRML